jgi:hypothetical protein
MSRRPVTLAHKSPLALSLCLLYALQQAWAQDTAPQPGQPDPTNHLNQFEIVGNSLVSAQQVCPPTVAIS